MRWVKIIGAYVQEVFWFVGTRLLILRTGSIGQASRGQAAVEYVLMLVVLSVFGQWLVQYFIEVLEEGTFILSGNMTYYLHTGTGWE